MAQRLLEIIVPEARAGDVEPLLEDRVLLGTWRDAKGERVLVRALVPVEDTQAVLDRLQQRFEGLGALHVAVLGVEATIPIPEVEQPPQPAAPAESEQERHQRVSREELYAEVADGTKTSAVFVAMTALSAVVAAVGLLRNNLAVVIGAMVIAPLLSPNVALALATTLGDLRLAIGALRANAAGIAIVIGLSFGVGHVLTVDPAIPEIVSRTQVGPADIVLALASGAAGTLAFTTALPGTLIGVMVAVALLPPAVTFGLLAGSHHLSLAWGAAVLLLTNVICVNLAGVTTFLIQGVRPRTWWEAERAKRATWAAVALWAFLLLVLAVTLFIAHPGQP